MLKQLILGFLVVASLSGCLKGSDLPNPCNYDPCEVKASATEIQNVQNYLNSAGITNAVQHCSGLFYVVETAGTGATPQTCSNITVEYEGRLTNGTVFDASTNPVTFNLSGVIMGWRNGMPKVNAGGRIHLYIPPTLGYGSSSAGSIPPNSILVFTVDLISVQ